MSLGHDTALPELKEFKMGLVLKVSLLVMVIVGAVSLWLLFQQDQTRAWFNYLIGAVMFLGMGLFGLFFILINHIVATKWVISVKRLYEAMAMTLPVAAVLVAVIFLGIPHLYEWSYEEILLNDYLMSKKAAFLQLDFFVIRMISYFAIWLFATWLLVRASFKQDLNRDVGITLFSRKASSLLMVAYALSVTFAAFDLLMSLEPHWFSTIYGVYFFAGFFQAGLAALYLVAAFLYKTGVLKDFLNSYHFHDIGKFVFAFSVFWAYIGFSQFMLYWYGDLPEETFWYMVRMNDGWEWIGLLLLFVRWLIPFLVLLPFAHKKIFQIAVPMCLLVIFGQWLDLYWNAMPATRLIYHASEAGHDASHFGAWFSLQEVLVGVGFFALFLFVLGSILERIRVVAIGDPRLMDSIHHHGH